MTPLEIIYYVALAIFIIIISALLIYFFTQNIDDTTYYKSNLDNKEYMIRDSGLPLVNLEAANYLATLRNNLDKLVNYIKQNAIPDQVSADRLYNRWYTCILRETSSNETSVAYTLNKNVEIRICIRKPDGSNQFEDINTAMFILTHELGHMMSITFGHNEEFRENFYNIVNVASMLGLYNPVDYSIDPVNYCGLNINTTPCSGGLCYVTGLSH